MSSRGCSPGPRLGSVPIREPERLLDDLNDGPARGRHRDDRAGRDPRRRRQRQDAGHQPPHGVRDRDGRRAGRTRCWSSRSPTRPPTEMVDRLRALGLPGVTARTFHAHAPEPAPPFLARRATTARRCPSCSTRSGSIVVRLARQLPGHYRFTPAKDLADEIEWAKARRIAPRPTRLEVAAARTRAADPGRPVRAHLRRLRAGQGAGEPDRLRRPAHSRPSTCSRPTPTPPRPSAPASAGSASTSTRTRTRSSSACSSCGSAIAATCASSATRTRRSTRSPAPRPTTSPASRRATRARGRSRSSRELPHHAADPRARQPPARRRGPREAAGGDAADGPDPDDRRARGRRRGAGALVARDPTPWSARGSPRPRSRSSCGSTPSSPPIEAALTRAGIPFRVRGHAVLRPARGPRRARRCGAGRSEARVVLLTALVARALGRAAWASSAAGRRRARREARERTASLALLGDRRASVVRRGRDTDATALVAEFERRAARAERAGAADGVNLLTLHRAKGLEWDAVFLPRSRKARCRSARRSTTTRRSPRSAGCCTSGITRARRHLALSWARARETRGRDDTTTAEPVPRRSAAADRKDGGRGSASAGRRVRELPGRRSRSAPGAGRRRPGDASFACLAHVPCPRGRDAPVRHRPRRDPGRHRRGAPAEQRGPPAGKGDRARQGRRLWRPVPSSRSWRPTCRAAWARPGVYAAARASDHGGPPHGDAR